MTAPAKENFLNTGGPIVFPEAQKMGLAEQQPSFGETLSDAFVSGVNGMPAARIGVALDHFIKSDEGDRLSKEEANEKYGIPGVLSFDKPVSSALASTLNGEKQREILRQNTIRNGSSGIAKSIVTWGAGALPSFLDPINIASTFIPGLGEVRVSTMLGGLASRAGDMGLEGLAGGLTKAGALNSRVAEGLESTGTGRFIQGASQGMTGQAVLEPLNYYLDQDEHNDWTMGSALGNIAFGGILGGGLHAIIPRARVEAKPDVTLEDLDRPLTDEQMQNPITASMERVGPDGRGQVLGESVAALVEDRPSNAMSLLHINEARNTADELGRLVQKYSGIEEDAARNSGEIERFNQQADAGFEARTNQQAQIQQQLAELRQHHDEVAREHAALNQHLEDLQGDSTPERISAIRQELNRPGLTGKRRAGLERELAMITEGGEDHKDINNLSVARLQAQEAGTGKLLESLRKQAARFEKKINPPARPDLRPRFRVQSARIQSRREVLLALTVRSLSRYARRVQSGIEEGDLHDLASLVLESRDPEASVHEALQMIYHERREGGSPAHHDSVEQAYQAALKRMADIEETAANNILRNLHNHESDEVSAMREGNNLLKEGAPDPKSVPGNGGQDHVLSEAMEFSRSLDRQLAALGENGISPDEMEKLRQEQAIYDGNVNAISSATACLTRNSK